MFEQQHQPLTVYHLCGLAAAGSAGERRSHLGTEAPGSPRASAAELGVCTGESSGPPRPVEQSPLSPSGSKGMSAGKQEMLRHSVRSSGQAARAQVHFKVTRKKRQRAHCRSGQGLRGAAAGTSRARSRGAAGRCPAPPGTHRRGCRIPSGGTWCAVLLCPRRLSQRRGPRALSGAFIGSRQLHALLCGRRRGGE